MRSQIRERSIFDLSESQVIDLYNHGKATKEHLGEVDGKLLMMQTMLGRQEEVGKALMGMME